MSLASLFASMEKEAEEEFAPGIPAGKAIAPLPTIKKPTKWHFIVQSHPAQRAGDHLDLRVINPATGIAHSWATKKALPEPGQKIAVFRQPDHTEEYSRHFQGAIEKGYGATRPGEKIRKVVDHPIEVLESGPEEMRFNAYHGRGPQEYLLTQGSSAKTWLLMNITKTRETLSHLPFSKPKYREIKPDKIDLSDDSHIMMAKLDGSHVSYDLEAGKRPRIYSYREPKERSTGAIEHSQKVPSLYTTRVPKALGHTVLRGELYARAHDGKHPVPAAQIGGMLNSDVWKSREAQERFGTLRPAIFDVVTFKGKDMTSAPHAERLEALKEVQKHMPQLEIPDTATTEKEKKTLFEAIRDKKHPATHEGVVLWEPGKASAPTKVKFKDEHDVVIREIFPAVDKTGKLKDEAGGFSYSHEPDGPIVGKVGTGFSRAQKQDMLRNKDHYIGLVARVHAMSKYPSGALEKPSFQDWHLDKNAPEELAKVAEVLSPFVDEVLKLAAKLKSSLGEHQTRVLKKLEDNGGVIVAHRMGGGKTLTALAAGINSKLPLDVVTPAGVVPHWEAQAKEHLSGKPKMRVRSYERAMMDAQKATPEEFSGMMQGEAIAVFDEAHRMRNTGTERHSNLAQPGMEAKKRLLLTGTPIFNQPSDLAILANIAAGEWRLPESQGAFKKLFLNEEEVNPTPAQRKEGIKSGIRYSLKNKDLLEAALAGHVDLHESDMDKDYPSRKDEVVSVEMSPKQHEVYNFLMDKVPAPIRRKIREGLPANKLESQALNALLAGARQSSLSPRPYVESMTDAEEEKAATKIHKAVNLLEKQRNEDPNFRGVVYSNYLEAGIHPYARMLLKKGVPFSIYHGGTTKKCREQIIEDYNAGKVPVLLVSSAGGEGLDLKGTKLVQILDPHFNNPKIEQVIGRGIRFKSHSHLPKEERHVVVQRFISTLPGGKGQSAEQWIQQGADEKDRVQKDILEVFRKAHDLPRVQDFASVFAEFKAKELAKKREGKNVRAGELAKWHRQLAKKKAK